MSNELPLEPMRVPRADGAMIALNPAQAQIYSMLPHFKTSGTIAFAADALPYRKEIEREMIAMYRLGVIHYRRYTYQIISFGQCIWYRVKPDE